MMWMWQDLEGQHAEKKKAYEIAMVGSSNRTAALEQEVAALRAEIEGNESRLHWLGEAMTLLEQQSQRIARPSDFADTVRRSGMLY